MDTGEWLTVFILGMATGALLLTFLWWCIKSD